MKKYVEENAKDDNPKRMSAYHAAEIVKETGIEPAEMVKHYVVTYNDTEPDVKEDIRELYAGLPRVELNVWKDVNTPSGEKKKDFKTQLGFVKKAIASCLLLVEEVYVVGTHTIENILLPVYQIDTPLFQITFSGDFHSWEAVVVTKVTDLEAFKATGKFDKAAVMLDGFPDGLKTYETIFENSHKFSIKLDSTYELYTFVYNLQNCLSR